KGSRVPPKRSSCRPARYAATASGLGERGAGRSVMAVAVGAAATTAAGSATTAPSTGTAGSTTTGGGGATTAAPTTGVATTTAPVSTGPAELSMVAFSVPQEANAAAEKAFAATPQGKGTTWTESYGASGDQSRAVVAGLDADYVHFSLETDMTRLVDAKLVAPDWNTGPNKGIVTTSVVVIAVRPGNPKNIKGWEDLIKDGVDVVTPNPGSSGSARWNILAAYGHVLANGGTEDEAKTYLTELFKHTVALPGSGRDATTAFLAGTGDALISYENEAILARQSGGELDYVVPDQTLLIENPGAVTTAANPRATAFLGFVLSAAGQTEYVKKGFRSLGNSVSGVTVDGANDPANPFPTPVKLMTITKDFGGWKAAADKFFKADTGIVTVIQQETGKTS
ncbi:MAG: subI, partial [Ilumatobacteraceae bacterium]|nr:subI [Ilumatobacteraceae bacterium]